MQLTSHTDYALRMLLYLMSHSARKVTTKEVAEAYRISLHHLTKVAKSLTKGGWLVASRGAGGGLMLAAHTPDTRIGDIVRYTENGFEIAECFNAATNTCPIIRVCQLKSVLYRARRAFFEVLDASTLRDIARNPAELTAVFADSRVPGEKAEKAGMRDGVKEGRRAVVAKRARAGRKVDAASRRIER